MEGSCRDLLELEHKNPSPCAIESSLLLIGKEKKKSSSLPVKPTIAPLPKSQVLDKVKGFLGIMAEANRRLEQEAKDNAEAFDIEALTGNESEVIEMNLMLGVADLHTPEAVNAAEAAIGGNQPAISLASQSEDSESSDESDSDGDEKSCGESSRKRTNIIELS